MSTTGSSTATARDRSRSGDATVGRPMESRRGSERVIASSSTAERRTATVLFQVDFASSMNDADMASLTHALELVMHMYPKMQIGPASLGVARLDFDSGLFLERRDGEGRWALEGRTWGHPPAAIVDDWHLGAAEAARQLDPAVDVPVRGAATSGRSSRSMDPLAHGHSPAAAGPRPRAR
jgi:hypothetical protein